MSGINNFIQGNPEVKSTAELSTYQGKYVGQLVFNSTTNMLFFWNGTTWINGNDGQINNVLVANNYASRPAIGATNILLYCIEERKIYVVDTASGQWVEQAGGAVITTFNSQVDVTSANGFGITNPSGYIYTKQTNNTGDTVGDTRIYNYDGIMYSQVCTVANPVKGAGTWVTRGSTGTNIIISGKSITCGTLHNIDNIFEVRLSPTVGARFFQIRTLTGASRSIRYQAPASFNTSTTLSMMGTSAEALINVTTSFQNISNQYDNVTASGWYTIHDDTANQLYKIELFYHTDNLYDIVVTTPTGFNNPITDKKNYAGNIKLNFPTASSLTGWTAGVVQNFNINSIIGTANLSPAPTTTPPFGQTAVISSIFDTTRGATPVVGRLIENPRNGQTHFWRIQGSWLGKSAGQVDNLNLQVNNPVSGFIASQNVTMGKSATGTFSVNLITIGDVASISTPNGYILRGITDITNAGLVISISDITRLSNAVENI
jgi:hypothetical protein